MGGQSTVIQYLVISSVFLWIIVLVSAAARIREYMKNRLKLRAVTVDEEGRVKKEYILSGIKELIIGKSTVSSLAHIDLSDSPYSSTIEDSHAILKKQDSYWYLQSEASNGMVGLRRTKNGVVYKLKRGVPYQIGAGDVIYISYEKIYIQK